MSVPPTDPDFLEFRAETRYQLEHFREMFQRLMPLHEQRSGDLRQIDSIKEDVGEIKKDVSTMRTEVGGLKEAQRKWMAGLFALNLLFIVITWLREAGIISFGAPP